MKKIFVLFSLLVVFFLETNAQAFQWARQFASRQSYGTAVVTDNNLSVISAGTYYDSIDLDPGPNRIMHYSFVSSTNSNAYLSKLDPNGNFVWGYSYFNTEYNRIHSIDVDNQNNIYVLGHFRDSIDLDFGVGTYWLYNPQSNNNDNFFVAKYNSNGFLLWGHAIVHTSSTFNGIGIFGHDLKIDHNNDILISGRFRDVVDFDPGASVLNLTSSTTSTSGSYWDKFLVKWDGSGSFLWAKQWAHSGWANNGWWGNHELDVDSNNNIFIPLTFRDSLDVDPSAVTNMVYSQGIHDVSLLKLSSSGSLVWNKEIGGAGQEYCHSLVSDRWGNIFYSIQSYSNPLDVDPGPAQNLINWTGNQWGKIILKLDNNGTFVWALQNLQNNYNSGWAGEGMATDTLGGLYLTTRIWNNSLNNNQWDLDPGPGAYIVSSNGSNDIAFQNLDSSGAFLWGGAMGGPFTDWSYGITTDGVLGVYLTGIFNQTADLNPTPDTTNLTSTPTSHDAFLVKLRKCNQSTSTILQNCDSVLYNSQYYYQDTVFQYHYPSSIGCDSAHAVVIDVMHTTNDTITVDTCMFYVWNSTTYTSSGVYSHNFSQTNSCDSFVTLDLTIGNNLQTTYDTVDCSPITINGSIYSQSGQYTQFYTASNGCDSNIVINFTRVIVDTSITVSTPASLLANATTATYQWIDCNTMQLIVGATSATFIATNSGSYACIVSQNGCTDTSSCYNIHIVPDAVNDYSILSRLYPNPSTGSYKLELDNTYTDIDLEMRTINGQLVWRKYYHTLKETNISIDKDAGVYMLFIKQGGRAQVKKLLKW